MIKSWEEPMECERVRDIYPDVLNGTAGDSVAQSVRAHVASCDECSAEILVLDAIYADETLVPAGLHERVVAAVTEPVRSWRFSAGRIAMAATVAAALIGGSVLLQQVAAPPSEPAAPATATATQRGLGVVGVEAALLSGNASLDDLSVEQLEQLLQEAES